MTHCVCLCVERAEWGGGGELRAAEGECSWFQTALCFNDRCSAPQWPGLNATSQRTLRSPFFHWKSVFVGVCFFYAVLLKSAHPPAAWFWRPAVFVFNGDVCSRPQIFFLLSLKGKSLRDDGSILLCLDFVLLTTSHENLCVVLLQCWIMKHFKGAI